MRLKVAQNSILLLFLFCLDRSTKADALAILTVLDHLFDARKGTAADEQNVLCVHLNKLLMRVLAPSLRRHIRYSSLKDLQQGLLNTLAGHIAGNGCVLALAGDLIHLIDIDNPPLGTLDIIIGGLNQPEQNVLHVIAHIAGLSQGGGIRNGKRHIQHLGQCLSKQCLAAARGTDQQDIALLELHIVAAAEVDPLIVIVNGDGKGDLCALLADDILIQYEMCIRDRIRAI